MFRPVREQGPPLRSGIAFPGGPQGLMTAIRAQGVGNMAPFPPHPPPHCPPPHPSQPFILPGRAVLLPSFRGALPGFPPLPMPPPPSSPPPLPPSPPAEVPPPPSPPAEVPSPASTPEDDSFAPPAMLPQDPEVVKNIEVLAEFVVRNGPQFEQLTRSKQGADPKFSFLFGGQPDSEAATGFEFYEWKKKDILRSQGKERGDGYVYAEHVKANVGVPSSKQGENGECTIEIDDSCMKDVSPEASPSNLSDAKDKKDIFHSTLTVSKQDSLQQEVEVQSPPKGVDRLSVPNTNLDIRNVEIVANYKQDDSSSSTSVSKEEALTSPENSNQMNSLQNHNSAFQEDMQPQCCVPLGDECKILESESRSETGSYECLPDNKGISESKSRSCTPEDLMSSSPPHGRSCSRSSSQELSNVEGCTNDQGLPDRGTQVHSLLLCVDYVKGTCLRGDTCRFVHQKFDSAADNNGERFSKIDMDNQRENLQEEERLQSETEGSLDTGAQEESFHVSNDEHKGKHNDENENDPPTHDAGSKHISSKEEENMPGDCGRVSPKHTDDGRFLDTSLHPLEQEIQSSDEQKTLKTALSGTVPEISKVSAQSPSLHLQEKTTQALEEQHHFKTSTSVAMPESAKILPQPVTAPTVAPLGPTSLRSIASFPKQPHEDQYMSGRSVSQQSKQLQEVRFGANYLDSDLKVTSDNALVVQRAVLAMKTPSTSTSLPPCQSSSSFGHSVSEQPVVSAALWTTQPVHTGLSRVSRLPTLGTKVQAMQPRFDEGSQFVPKSGQNFPHTDLQPGFATVPMQSSTVSNIPPLLGPRSQQPISTLHNVPNMTSQVAPIAPVVSQTQSYQKNPTPVPAPVPLPIFIQSNNFTYSTFNPGRTLTQGLPSEPQQQKLSQEPYDPLSDSFELKPAAGKAAVSNSLHHNCDKNDILNSQRNIEKGQVDALEISNRILCAARAGKHVIDTVAPKPENVKKRSSPQKYESLLLHNALKDKVLARPSVKQESRLEVEVGTNKRKREEQLDLYSPVYAVEDSDNVLDVRQSMNNEMPQGTGETNTDKQATAKSNKEEKQLKLVRTALTDYVKEVLKPTWREGHLSKEAFKTIAKKAVDKILSTVPDHHIPKGPDKVDRFILSSQEKISKLVQGYLEKYVKPT